MANLLHIETATEICSICTSIDDVVNVHKTATQPQVHTRLATLMIEDVMRSSNLSYADLDAIVVSNGPGSYTGLRVGASIAKGLCFGLDIPLLTVNTLESLFLSSFKPESNSNVLYIPMIDARRMEVYLAQYDQSKRNTLENQPFILDESSFESLLKTYDKIVFSGNGAPKFEELVDNSAFEFTQNVCDARHLVKPGYDQFKAKEFADLAYFSPNYIKLPNITKSKKKVF